MTKPESVEDWQALNEASELEKALIARFELMGRLVQQSQALAAHRRHPVSRHQLLCSLRTTGYGRVTNEH